MRAALPHQDTRLITQAALAGLDELYCAGFAFSKAEVLLMDLCALRDLFAPTQPAHSQRVMALLNSINVTWGARYAASRRGTGDSAWSMRRELMSQSFKTRVDQLWKVFAR